MDDGTATGYALLLMAGILYLLPRVIASGRGHHQRSAIWALTILAGWTGLGWLVAFVWSATAVRKLTDGYMA